MSKFESAVFVGMFFMVSIIFGMGFLAEYVAGDSSFIGFLIMLSSIPMGLFAFFGVIWFVLVPHSIREDDQKILDQMRKERLDR
jgi:hypothetical protein